jgi:hypothetical protein
VDDRLTSPDAVVAEWRYVLLDRHLDQMLAIAEDLGDELLNETPALPGANSPYQILFHCCGMLEWWTREANLAVDVGRDRAAEFEARGDLASLQARVGQVRAQLLADLAATDLAAAPRAELSAEYTSTPLGRTARGVLLHVLEELAQHHGHLELTRDLLRNSPDRRG